MFKTIKGYATFPIFIYFPLRSSGKSVYAVKRTPISTYRAV